jgi:fructose-1-phosphate kinase PfkB-like protein
MATSKRLARRPKARPAPAKAPADRFETFVTTLEEELKDRYAFATSGSVAEEVLHEVYMAVLQAAKVARAVNQGAK